MKRTWYHLAQGHCFGPFTFEHLRDRAVDGMLKPTDEVMCETQTGGDYLEAGRVPGLFTEMPVVAEVTVLTAVDSTPEAPPRQVNRTLVLGLLIGALVVMVLGLVLAMVLRQQG